MKKMSGKGRLLCMTLVVGAVAGDVTMGASSTAFAAAPVVVTTNVDVVDAADGVVSLREAVSLASSDGGATEVQLTPGVVYALTLCDATSEDANISGDLDHPEEQALSIVGAADNVAQILQTCPGERLIDNLRSSPLELRGVALSRGRGRGHGGAVRSVGPVIIESSSFIDNQVSADASGAGDGGAVSSLQGAQVVMSTFIGNSASGAGGAVSVARSASFAQTDFTSNSATTGGAIHAVGQVDVRGGTFLNNSASALGGAVRVLSDLQTSSVINGSVFRSNTAGGDGGAVYVNGAAAAFANVSLLIKNATMESNTASNGGAVGVGLTNGGGGLTVVGGTFEANTAKNGGGAIRFTQSSWAATFQVVGATFLANRAGTTGGAVMAAYPGLAISRSTFTGNIADSDGGALWTTGVSAAPGFTWSTNYRISQSTFTSNGSGRDGGAIAHAGVTTTNPSMLRVQHTTFSKNTAAGRGGALYAASGKTSEVRTSGFVDNRAADGGAVASAGSAMLTNATLAGNHAQRGGGAFFAGSAEMLHVTFTGNSAASAAALFSDGAVGSLTASVVANGVGALCDSTWFSGGNNVITDGSCGLAAAGDLQVGTGLAFTLIGGVAVPSAGNPVIDHYAAPCGVSDDQRSFPRPIGAGCDAGAVERALSDGDIDVAPVRK